MPITRYAPRRVHLGGEGTTVNDIYAYEGITPGHLIQLFNDAGTPKYRRHNAAGGNASPTFALDQGEMNKGIDDAYAVGDMVAALVGRPGTTINGLVAAAAPAIDAGDFLESAGDGTLRKHVPQTVNEGGAAVATLAARQIVAIARENVDNSGGVTAVRVRAEVV